MPSPASTAPDPPSGSEYPLCVARDRAGWSPRDWLTDAVPIAPGTTIELRCDVGGDGRRVTLRPLPTGAIALGRPDALPLTRNGLAGLVATMCLPAVDPLDALFGEIRRVLRPAGTLTALVPAVPRRSPAELRAWRPLNRAMTGHPGFRHSAARDHLGWLLTAADFAVLADQRRTFWLPMDDPERAHAAATGLVAAGIWPPDLAPTQFELARAELARVARPGYRLPIPLRLLVSRR